MVDTPPPTVSGWLHVGHVFSYTQTDVLVRYHRMRGRNVHDPMGWDDDGVPTERRASPRRSMTNASAARSAAIRGLYHGAGRPATRAAVTAPRAHPRPALVARRGGRA